MITIGVFAKQKILKEALCAMLESNDEFSAVAVTSEIADLTEEIKEAQYNILLFNMYSPNFEEMRFFSQINTSCPRTRILVMSQSNDEELILKTIKSGAKGFLDANAGRTELFEAIYTLRGGYDFYSESITHMLLGKYLKKIKNKEVVEEEPGVEALSQRQIEIIRMWGNNMSNKEIADRLFISVRTVESHKNHIMQRLNLKTNIDMIKFGIKNNLIEI
ncbi:MAG: response regulator transcription factor [Paludibacteraceae bacterium]|nr:response regulator transcription factor [Paludibacteraceae bacterium]